MELKKTNKKQELGDIPDCNLTGKITAWFLFYFIYSQGVFSVTFLFSIFSSISGMLLRFHSDVQGSCKPT